MKTSATDLDRFCRIQHALLSEKFIYFFQGPLRDIKQFELHFHSSGDKGSLLQENIENLITGITARWKNRIFYDVKGFQIQLIKESGRGG